MRRYRLFALAVMLIAIVFLVYLVALRLHPHLTNSNLQYQDSAHGIVFEYPENFVLEQGDADLTTEWQSYSNGTRGQHIARVTIPKESQPNTNFGDAYWQVGVSKDAKALATCTNPSGYIRHGVRTISGIEFSVFGMSDAGAGNFYETTSYRAKLADKCIVAEYVVHSLNIQNFPAEYGIKEFDKAKVLNILESITQSLHISNPQS